MVNKLPTMNCITRWPIVVMTIGYFVVMGESYDIIGRDKFEFYALLTFGYKVPIYKALVEQLFYGGYDRWLRNCMKKVRFGLQ